MTTRQISTEEHALLQTHYAGLCLECGCVTYGVPPDASEFPCDNCERPAVAGPDVLATRGLVKDRQHDNSR